MKTTIIGLISLDALVALLGVGAISRRGADDPCGGYPKDLQCHLATLQCVPPDVHR